LAGLDAAEISRNIDMWNANRTANGFSASAIYEGEFDSDEDANLFTKMLKNRNSGADVAGDILVAKRAKGGSTKGNFIDLTNTKDGEFLNLKNLSTDDLISCHSFYRSLCSMPDNTGFDTDRILNEYNIFINTTAKYEQQKFIENINFILNSINPAFDLGEISFINKPPVIREKIYKIWELRKIEGLEYNENDPQQNEFYSDYKRNTK
jgi:hypothetical protein